MIGRSFAECCGCLAGGMVVIGHLTGRRHSGDNWDKPADVGALFREVFLEKHGTTNCMVLRDRFGEQKQVELCREVVR